MTSLITQFLLKILLQTTALLRKNYEKRKGLFLKHEYIDFQILQGSEATHRRWGGSLYNRSVEIGVHLLKLWPKNKVAVLF